MVAARLPDECQAGRRCLADWLRERMKEIKDGIAPDYDLADYKAQAESYMILGQAERKRWDELGIRC